MISLWLDFKLFGNGNGMRSPHCDDVFYWLSGRMYNWIGGFGAQIRSREWKRPPAGTTRRLIGKDFTVFQTRRKFLRVECSWALAQPNCPTIEEIRELKVQLDRAA